MGNAMQSPFHQNIGLSIRLVVLSALCLTLMTIDHRNESFRGLRSTVSSYLIYPLQYIVTIPSKITQWAGENLTTRTNLLNENAELRETNLRLLTDQQRLASLQRENERLRELLGASSQLEADILIAEVLEVDQDYYTQQILINKGSEHNVYLGQAVVDATGILGQVIQLNKQSAVVLLISDPGHAIPIQNNRNGIRTIAQGKGDPNELDLLHIPNNTDIKVGDLMTSSGLGARFPPNYPVATVAEVKIRPSEPFALVTAKPAAALDRSREVLLVWYSRETTP